MIIVLLFCRMTRYNCNVIGFVPAQQHSAIHFQSTGEINSDEFITCSNIFRSRTKHLLGILLVSKFLEVRYAIF